MSYPERVVKAINRAKACISAGQAADAIPELQKAIDKYPKADEAWILLGQAKGILDDHEMAEKALRKGLGLNPKHPDGWFWLGLSLSQQQRYKEALVAYERYTMHHKGCPPLGVLHNVASCLLNLDKYGEAIEMYKLALNMRDTSDSWGMLGVAYQGDNKHRLALDAYQKAAERGGGGYTLNLNAGVCCYVLKDFEAAIKYATAALETTPGDPVATYNQLVAIAGAGRTDEAVQHGEGITIPRVAQARLMLQNYVDAATPEAILRDHVAYAATLPAGDRPTITGGPIGDGQPLRLGFISGDFRQHPVAYFLIGLLQAFDRSRVSVNLYSTNPDRDAITARFAEMENTTWVDLSALSPEDMAQRIRLDELHIAIDLTGHSSTGTGPELLALGVAPVQTSYLGYGATLGLPACTHFFTDAVLDPPGLTESHFSETLVRLGDCFATFSPLEDLPEIGGSPMARNGYPTLGVFTQLSKISASSLALWSSALNAVPNARLIVTAPGLGIDQAQQRMLERMAQAGMDTSRVELRGERPMADYLEAHNEIDVLLETTPWNAHTTALHALWMGVPTITASGNRHVARFGEHVLRNARLEHYVAASTAEYGACVASAVSTVEALASFRLYARQIMAESPLADHTGLARRFEQACRRIYNEATGQ